MKAAAGSTLWLMQHEFRLYWRSRGSVSTVFLIVTQVVLHLIALVIAVAMTMQQTGPMPQDRLVALMTFLLGLLLFFMIPRGLSSVVDALYARADLDLLLSSPLALNSIVGTRIYAIAATVTLEVAMLVWPFANVFVLFGMIAWFKAYFLIAALGTLATACSVLVMLGLFRVFGPKRTRVVAHLTSAFVGFSFMLIGFLPNILRINAERAQSTSIALPKVNPAIAQSIRIPAEKILDGWLPTVFFAIACVALLAVTVKLFSERFILASQVVASLGASGPVRALQRGLRFRSSFRAILIFKELRLIVRGPLLALLVQQSVVLVPIAATLIARPSHSVGTPWIWLMTILFSGSMASSLSWLTVCAEDAPELLAASPLSMPVIVRAKVEAALLPVVPLVLLPLIALWRHHLWFGVALTICSLGCGISCALLNIRNPVAAKRSDFSNRNRGRPINGFIELATIAVWVLVCFLAASLSSWG